MKSINRITIQCSHCNHLFHSPVKSGTVRIKCPACDNVLEMSTDNSKLYSIVNIEQGTTEWLDWRMQGIGASDAPAIMGENPWKTPKRLLKEKLEGSNLRPNEAMKRGITLEPEARRSYEQKVGVQVPPICIQSNKYSWLRASLDGLSEDGNLIVEIKCGESVYRKSASSGEVPVYYYGQLQHMLAIINLPCIDFWCYLPDRPEVHLAISKDDAYIKRLIQAEHSFWKEVLAHR